MAKLTITMVAKAAAVFIALTAGATFAHAQEFSRPGVIVFSATTAQMETALSGRCAKMTTRKIDPPFLPNIQTEQMQIDCDGFEFFGKPRWAEFVIGDDSLEMVWILTEAEEEDALRAAMTEAYGAPSSVSDDMELFAAARAGLRKDKPEVLFYSHKLAPLMQAHHQGE